LALDVLGETLRQPAIHDGLLQDYPDGPERVRTVDDFFPA
jgi:hypothetical protein